MCLADVVGNEDAIALSKNSTLKKLSLVWCGVGDEGAKALAQNTTLIELDISGNEISEEGLKAFSSNQSILSLKISPKICTSTLLETLSKNTTLTHLDISSEDFERKSFCALEKSPNIKSLTLSSVSGKDIEELAQNPHLTKLDTSQCIYRIKDFTALANMKCIQTLCLHACSIGNTGAIALSKNLTLTKLSVPNNDISYTGIKALAQSKTLRDLDVSENHFDYESLEALAVNRTLTSLNIWTTKRMYNMLEPFRGNSTLTSLKTNLYGIEGAKIPATLSNLTDLDISWSRGVVHKTLKSWSDSGTLPPVDVFPDDESSFKKLGIPSSHDIVVEAIKSLVGFKSLLSLNIAGNSLDDEDAAILAKCSTLTSLNIQQNNLTRKGIRSLVENLPLLRLDMDGWPGNFVWREMVDMKLGPIQNHLPQLSSFLFSSFSRLLPSDVEKIILDYCKSPPIVFRCSYDGN
jgi:hypothetical protein